MQTQASSFPGSWAILSLVSSVIPYFHNTLASIPVKAYPDAGSLAHLRPMEINSIFQAECADLNASISDKIRRHSVGPVPVCSP
jgi:hypothetical protein